MAENPEGDHHFATGRPLAEQLGYDSTELDRLPEAAVESFAGVGDYFELADLDEGDNVLDLGSGAGTDVFRAAHRVGPSGSVTGLDILVDENIDPQTAGFLRDLGHDADHVEASLGKRTMDIPHAEHAREHDLLVLTNESDFLRPDRRQGLRVLYVPENSMRAQAIARLVGELASLVPDQADLPAIVDHRESNFPTSINRFIDDVLCKARGHTSTPSLLTPTLTFRFFRSRCPAPPLFEG